MTFHVLIERPAYGGCGQDAPHVFDTNGVLPIPDNRRCICGAQTWAEAVEDAKLRIIGKGEVDGKLKD